MNWTKVTIISLILLWLVTLGLFAYQGYRIQEMQYLLDLYKQQPQKIWA